MGRCPELTRSPHRPMREICTSGSEGGVAQTNAPSLPPIGSTNRIPHKLPPDLYSNDQVFASTHKPETPHETYPDYISSGAVTAAGTTGFTLTGLLRVGEGLQPPGDRGETRCWLMISGLQQTELHVVVVIDDGVLADPVERGH